MYSVNPFYLKVQNSFNRVADCYNDYSDFQFQVAKNLCNMMTVKENQRILDLGCGTGYVAKIINKSKIIQLDISFNMCKRAKLSNYSTINAKMESLPLSNRCVDFVTSSFSLHWSYDISKTISEINRIINKHGKLFISIPVNNTFYELNDILRMLKLPEIEFFKFKYLLNLLTKSGFKIDTRSYTFSSTEHYDSFENFIRSIKKIGANINRNKNLMNKKIFYSISELYNQNLLTPSGIKVSWEIAYIVATR